LNRNNRRPPRDFNKKDSGVTVQLDEPLKKLFFQIYQEYPGENLLKFLIDYLTIVKQNIYIIQKPGYQWHKLEVSLAKTFKKYYGTSLKNHFKHYLGQCVRVLAEHIEKDEKEEFINTVRKIAEETNTARPDGNYGKFLARYMGLVLLICKKEHRPRPQTRKKPY
jgi:hypothetical protein